MWLKIQRIKTHAAMLDLGNGPGPTLMLMSLERGRCSHDVILGIECNKLKLVNLIP